MSPASNTPIEWDTLLDNIASGRTILCLGAELFTFDGVQLDERLRQAVGAQVKAYDDGLFYFGGGSDIVAYSKIKRTWQQPVPGLEALLAQVARIPFQVLISLTPDRFLKQAFDQQGLACQHAVYVRRKPAPEIDPPGPGLPLVYQFLGELDQRESLVLTHDDLYDFFESVIEHRSMPELLKTRIREAYNFIFLGLPFDKWYMQLLLRVLGQHTNKNALKYAANHALSSQTQAFCFEQFNIFSVPVQTGPFVAELYQRCEAAGILRGAGASASPKARFLALLKQDRLREALDELLDRYESLLPPDTEGLNLLIGLSGRLSRLEQKQGLGSISHDNAQVERAQLRESLVGFIQEMPRL
jgi:hypothetical protein